MVTKVPSKNFYRSFLIIFMDVIKNFLKIFFLFIFLFSTLCFAAQTKKPPLIPYMDQVIKRKKTVIAKKCLKHLKHGTKGFMIIEIGVSRKGKTNTRLIATEIKNTFFLNCTLSVLRRIQFKKFKEPVTRIYRFFI